MQPTASIDQAAWDAKLRQYLSLTDRAVKEALTAKAFDFIRFAIESTLKATAEKIEYQLGVIAYERKVGKSGKALKFSRRNARAVLAQQKGRTLAERLYIKRLIDKGEKPKDEAAIREGALKIISARKRSVAFGRSGWVPAARALAVSLFGKSARKNMPAESGTVKGTRKGFAKIDMAVLFPQIDLINSASKNEPSMFKVIEQGAAEGLRKTMAFMDEYIARKLKEKYQQQGITTT